VPQQHRSSLARLGTQLAVLLADAGDLDEPRARADAGDGYAAWYLVVRLARRGDLDELRARAGTDPFAAWELAGLLAERGIWTRPSNSCACTPTPATIPPPTGWPTC
jgi:hypothetical protein